MPNKQETHMRGTVVSVVLGLLGSALGGMLMVAGPQAAPDNQGPVTSLGVFLLVVGGLAFSIAILVELFSIRPALHSVQTALSLLLKPPPAALQPPNPPSSNIFNAPKQGA
jgi:hypothetical protein